MEHFFTVVKSNRVNLCQLCSDSSHDCAAKMKRLACSLRQLLGREVPEQSAEL